MRHVGRNLVSQKAVQGPAMPEPDMRMLSGGVDIVELGMEVWGGDVAEILWEGERREESIDG
jgi:hypothetical protein